MSEPIIIETPAPPTRERLVVVPVRRIVPESRDATPDDLARGGFAPLAAFVDPLDLLSPPTLAGALEAIAGTRKDADRWEDERDEAASFARAATARAEKAEGLLIQRETELRLAREDGDERARDLRQAYERAAAAAEKAERERDEAVKESAGALRSAHAQHEARATDEDLFAIARAAYDAPREQEAGVPWLDRIARAVAAHVRKERCLVAQAVGARVRVEVSPAGEFEHYVVVGDIRAYVPTYEAPATLARLLGEVKR